MTFKIEKAIATQPVILRENWEEKLNFSIQKNLSSTKNILFVGMGSSYHSALWAHWFCQLATAGKIGSFAVSTWDYLQLYKEFQNYTVVFISHRGNQGLTKEALVLSKKGKRILVCAKKSPALKEETVFTTEPELAQAHTMSLIGAMAATSEMVGCILGKKAQQQFKSDRIKTATIMERLIQNTSLEQKHRIIPNNEKHFIGGGPFHPIALELVLKVREILHQNANGYNVEEFLHGPLCSVEKKDIILILQNKSSFKETYSKCIRSAKALGAVTTQAIFDLSSNKQTHPTQICWEAVLALCWGQLFCVTQAKKLGINPDLNRTNELRYQLAHELSK